MKQNKQKNRHFTTTASFTHHFRYPRKEPDLSPSSKKPKQAKQNKTPLFLNSFLPFSSSTLHCLHLYLRECHSKTIKIATICHIWILQAYTNTVCGFVHYMDVVGSWAVLLRTPHPMAEHFYPLCVGQWAPPGGKQPPGLMICVTCIVWPPWGVGVMRGWVI